MERITRHQMYMQMAELVSRRSTCFRRNVGAVITLDHKLVAMGYNGSAPGEPHCSGNGCAPPQQGCTRAIHAEINAINRLPPPPYVGYGKLPVMRMYVTESPCPDCAKRITASCIEELYFLHTYRLPQGRNMLIDAGVLLYRMTPSGYMINCKTEELVTDAS